MMRGHLIGTLWAAKKVPGLDGRKLALVAEYHGDTPTGRVVVAIDLLDAEPLSAVIVSFGSGARNAVDPSGGRRVLADAAITQRIDGTTLTIGDSDVCG